MALPAARAHPLILHDALITAPYPLLSLMRALRLETLIWLLPR